MAQFPAERREHAMTDAAFDVVERLDAFATERGHTLLELAMSWLAACPRWPRSSPARPRLSRCGPTRPPSAWALTDDERAEVDVLSRR